MTHTHKELATDWDLWSDYVDPNATMTIDEFRAMTIDERIALIEETFGPDKTGGDSCPTLPSP